MVVEKEGEESLSPRPVDPDLPSMTATGSPLLSRTMVDPPPPTPLLLPFAVVTTLRHEREEGYDFSLFRRCLPFSAT